MDYVDFRGLVVSPKRFDYDHLLFIVVACCEPSFGVNNSFSFCITRMKISIKHYMV